MKKKCLVVIQNLTRSGSPQTFLHVISVLNKIGFVVDTYVLSVIEPNNDLALMDEYKLSCNNIYTDNTQLNSLCYRLLPFLSFQKIKKLISQKKYDLVFTNNLYLSAFLVKKKIKNLKIAYYALGNANLRSRYAILRRRDMRVKQLVANVDAYIALSRSAIFNDIKVKRLYKLIDYPECYYPNLKKKQKEGFALGQIGYFCTNKNQLFSVNLINKLKLTMPNIKMYFIGYQSSEEPYYFDELKKSIVANKLENNIVFLPPDFCKKDFFESIDILLVPSYHEGLCLSLLEAQFSGVNCIASTAIPEEADFGLLGIFPLNIDDWIDYISKNGYKGKKLTGLFTKNDFESQLMKIINEIF